MSIADDVTAPVRAGDRSPTLVPARAVAWWVGITFALLNVYYAHRWLFRYSSTGTSPTYSDTPFAWKMGKYLLAAIATFVAVLLIWRRRTGAGRGLLLVPSGGFVPVAVLWCGLAFSMTALAASEESAREQVAWFAFVPLALGLALSTPTVASLGVLARIGVALVGYHFLFTLVQLWYYFVDDRLPALAYGQGSLDRFGGGLDDPNGFGMMMVLPALFVVMMWRRFPARWMALGAAFVCSFLLFVPISFSALIGLVVGLLALAPLLGRWRVLLWVTAGTVITALVLLAIPYVRRVVANKSDSARTRLDLGGGPNGLSGYLDELDGGRFWFGWPGRGVDSENSYVLAFTSFGVVGLVLLVIVVWIALRQGFRAVRLADDAGAELVRNCFVALTAYVAGFAVASAGVPYFSVVPTNMLFWITATVVAVGPAAVRRLVADRRCSDGGSVTDRAEVATP